MPADGGVEMTSEQYIAARTAYLLSVLVPDIPEGIAHSAREEFIADRIDALRMGFPEYLTLGRIARFELLELAMESIERRKRENAV